MPPDADAGAARARVLPAGLAVAELPRVVLPPAEAGRLRRGQAVPLPPGVSAGGVVAVFDAAGRLAAVARANGGGLRPEKVLPQPPGG